MSVSPHVLTESGHDGTAYELTGPKALTHEEMAETLTRVLGRPIRYVRISDEDYRQTLLASGASEEIADASVDANRYVRSVPSTVTSSVRDVTGREPISFEGFCRDRAAALAATS
ncbi:hypothetical protein CV102_14230 [Natronococcus pandeyae]|uniref:NmrA-like domain-containing protein n=1 Tax=Natronococcus pandeyae TaxID=2055836 RepID=A0A8J8TPX3_9EURY|nr:hypothetical protein [Natronococcus pandeyae]TYL37883.1 hypothetical protein CV102_14230 [Natronococcus pandeyae]